MPEPLLLGNLLNMINVFATSVRNNRSKQCETFNQGWSHLVAVTCDAMEAELENTFKKV